MKFIVCRTSVWDDEESPCKEAKKDSVICVFNNHLNGKMMDCWSIEINTLEELIKFCKKYGEIVIGNYMWNESYKEIEIYDTYRE